MQKEKVVTDNLIDEWGVSITDFNKGGFGNLMGTFKVYPSLAHIYIKEEIQHDVETGDEVTVQVIDTERLFNEIALIYITALHAQYPAIQILGYRDLQKHTKIYLKKAVYAGMIYGINNRAIRDKMMNITKTGIRTAIHQDAVKFMNPKDMFGQQGNNLLDMSGIDKYDIIETNTEMMQVIKNGYHIIGKFDPKLIPDLTERYVKVKGGK